MAFAASLSQYRVIACSSAVLFSVTIAAFLIANANASVTIDVQSNAVDHDPRRAQEVHDDKAADDGVHITFQDLYASMVFVASVYVGGQIARRLFRMPSLVGEIMIGILLGPNLADFVPNPTAFVMLGQIGLILLVVEAGLDINPTLLNLIGSKGVLIAIVGSILPMSIATSLAFAIGTDTIGSLATGASFGPTSFGIAMNILREGNIVNTPVGQLIVGAAVMDDMLALVILSQLQAWVGDFSPSTILLPILSALSFLLLGGYIAVRPLPRLLQNHFFSRIHEQHHGSAGMTLLFLLLFSLMPATHYAQSSPLLGGFLSGLVFCRNDPVRAHFESQMKRVRQWLMKMFFAAAIGFQVPVAEFYDWSVVGYGLMFTLALSGKLAVGFMVPNFHTVERFRGLHRRDCCITGWSMAAEGEFAFVIAVFSVDQGLISGDLYASIVLAILLSTIVPPFLLNFTISHYGRMEERRIKEAEDEVGESMVVAPDELERRLREHIQANKVVYLRIQIQCKPTWGLIPKIISTLLTLHLEVIDHRSWHSRGCDSTLATEIFVEDDCWLRHDEESRRITMQERLDEVIATVTAAIHPPDMCHVQVTRWHPGIMQTMPEETNSSSHATAPHINPPIRDVLARQASKALESNMNLQCSATKQHTVEEIGGSAKELPRRRKMCSSPASLFDERPYDLAGGTRMPLSSRGAD